MELQSGAEINSIPHEMLILGFLRQIYNNENDTNMTATIINLCYMFYVDQTTIDKIDSFIQKEIKEVTELLDTTQDQSLLLLLKNNWDSMFISDKYFNDPIGTLTKAGCCLTEETQQQNQSNCQFCVEFNEILFSLDCQHQIMCENCWIYYLKSSLHSVNCVSLTCPKNKCNIIIPHQVWKDFLFKKDKLFYQLYLTYVRQNCMHFSKAFTKCSNDKCTMVYFSSKAGGISSAKWCDCGSLYNCSSCKQELHFPMSCDYAKIWRNKIRLEENTVKKIVDGRNKCPNCHVDVGEMQGSQNVVCRYCDHKFCFFCKINWSRHVDQNNAFIGCNDVKRDKKEKFEFFFNAYNSHL
eukprot:427407_1